MSLKEAWGADADLGNRDPNSLNDHLKVTFEETLGEPDHTHSIDCVWKFSYKCFNLWKTLCYIILTTICGIPHAICWGCAFACLAFNHIWQLTPCLKCCEIHLAITKKCNEIIFGCMVTPMCEAIGSCFNAFKK